MAHREIEHRIWLLYLVTPTRFGGLLSASLILTGLLGIFWAVGIFDSPAPPDTSPTIALFFCAILAYIVPAFHFITERTAQAFEDLVPHLDAEPQTAQAWRRSFTHKNRRWLLVNLSAATAAWMAHCLLMYGSVGAVIARCSSHVAHFAVILGTALVWTVMTLVISALVNNALLFNRLARSVPIDLLDHEYLTAFARVSVISTLAVIGALASFPIMWIDSAVDPMASAPGMTAIASAMVFLFLLPIWPVHRAIAHAKRVEFDGIRSSLEKIRKQPLGADLENPEGLARINQLLIYRREITQVREWPFDLGIVTRLGLYLIIPPLSWVCAALIENVVQDYL